MFAGDRATGGDAGQHDFRHRGVYAGGRVGVVGVVGDVGVQVAVAGVEHVAHLHAVSRGNLVNGGQYVG